MDLSHLPEEIGLFISELLNDNLIISFLSFMLIIFCVTLLRVTYIGYKYSGKLHKIIRELSRLAKSTEDKNALSLVARDSLRSGDIKKILEDSSLSNERIRLSQAIILVDRMKCEVDYKVLRDIFNPNELVSRFLPRSLSQAAPLLLTLGVIGTFLGLIIGVSRAGAGLASPDVSEARAAMAGLLDGAKLAFVTSLAGLFLATVTGMAVRAARKRLVASVESLIAHFHEVFVNADWERDMKVDISNTRAAINEMNTTLTETQKALNELIKTQGATLEAILRQSQQLDTLINIELQTQETIGDIIEFILQSPRRADGTHDSVTPNHSNQETTDG